MAWVQSLAWVPTLAQELLQVMGTAKNKTKQKQTFFKKNFKENKLWFKKKKNLVLLINKNLILCLGNIYYELFFIGIYEAHQRKQTLKIGSGDSVHYWLGKYNNVVFE